MALKIRLARGGAKKRPFYHIVVADARSPRDGRFVERVGTYNPMLPQDSQDRVRLNVDRIKHWLSVGAQATDRVALFLGMAKITDMPVQRVTPQKSAPKAKAQERVKAEEEAKTAKEEAAKAPKKEAEGEKEKPESEEEIGEGGVEMGEGGHHSSSKEHVHVPHSPQATPAPGAHASAEQTTQDASSSDDATQVASADSVDTPDTTTV